MTAPLWLLSLRRRPLISLLLLLLSAAAVLTSVTGPLLVRAVHQSSLQRAVSTAIPQARQLTVSATLQPDEQLTNLIDAVTGPFGATDQGPGGGLWGPLRVDVASQSNLGWTPNGQSRRVSRVSGVDASCAPFTVVTGRCPAAVGEALLSADGPGAAALVGQSVTYSGGPRAAGSLLVVGLYDPSRSKPAQLLRPGTTAGQLAQIDADPVVVPQAGLLRLQLGAQAVGRLTLAGGMSVQQEPAARATLAAVQRAAAPDGGRILGFESQLPQLLDANDTEVASAALTMGVIVVQAELVGFFALFILLQRLGRLRAPEWAIGRLRGLPLSRWLVSVWADSALAVLVGAVLGFLLAVGLDTVVVHAALGRQIPVEWRRWPVWSAAAATAAAALVALVVASLQILRRPLLEAIAEVSEPRRLGRSAAVLQTAVVLVAVVAGYQLLSGGDVGSTGSQLALAAPALLALAAALVAVRLVVLIVSVFTARAPRSITGLVVGRRAARMPSTLTPAMVIAAALAMSVFAVQIWQLSVRNQTSRAVMITGAQTVLTVRTPVGVDLMTAVDKADPTGRYAMAVREREESVGTGTARMIAVDTSRLAAVSPEVSARLGGPGLASLLDPATRRPGQGSPITLTGSSVEVDLRTSKLGPPGAGQASGTPALLLTVETEDGSWQQVGLGALPAAGRSATLSGTMTCSWGCRLVAIELVSMAGEGYATSFTLTSLQTDVTPASSLAPLLRQSTEWQENIGQQTDPERPATISPTATSAGLKLDATDLYGGDPNRVSTTDVEAVLPALLQQGVDPEPFAANAVNGTGLDGGNQLLRVVGRVPVLPRTLDDGVLVDLRNASAQSEPATDRGTEEVWLSASAPPGIEQALASQQIQVTGSQRLVDVRDDLLHQAVSRGALLSNLLAVAALLIAALTFVGSRAIEAGRRRRDWAVLADVGLPDGRIRLLCFLEIALPALLGVVIGIGAGLATVVAAAARLPLVGASGAGTPLDLGLAWPWVLGIGVGAAVVILVFAAVGSLLETARLTSPGAQR